MILKPTQLNLEGKCEPLLCLRQPSQESQVWSVPHSSPAKNLKHLWDVLRRWTGAKKVAGMTALTRHVRPTATQMESWLPTQMTGCCPPEINTSQCTLSTHKKRTRRTSLVLSNWLQLTLPLKHNVKHFSINFQGVCKICPEKPVYFQMYFKKVNRTYVVACFSKIIRQFSFICFKVRISKIPAKSDTLSLSTSYPDIIFG